MLYVETGIKAAAVVRETPPKPKPSVDVVAPEVSAAGVQVRGLAVDVVLDPGVDAAERVISVLGCLAALDGGGLNRGLDGAQGQSSRACGDLDRRRGDERGQEAQGGNSGRPELHFAGGKRKKEYLS